MRSGEVKVDILKDKGQHCHEEPPMPNQINATTTSRNGVAARAIHTTRAEVDTSSIESWGG